MSYLVIWSFSFSLILCLNQPVQQAEYTFSVQGRAVDSFGGPVKNACIVVSPVPEPVMGDIGVGIRADDGGRFRYSETVNDPSLKRLLYVVGPLHEGAVSLIRPPFYWLPKVPGPQYSGRLILIIPNGVLDVGDVPIQVRYGAVNVRIQDQSGAPILVSADKWEYVWLRVRDLRKHLIYESGLSKDTIQSKVHVGESMIPINLSEGVCRLEVSIKGHGGPWRSSLTPIRVTSMRSPIEVRLRIT